MGAFVLHETPARRIHGAGIFTRAGQCSQVCELVRRAEDKPHLEEVI